MCRDHPRVGGEKGSLLVSMYHPGGSPPRGRGKVPRWGYTLYRHRDHPRVGGEKLEKLVKGALLIGSPPRRRGKEVADEGIGGIIRITPAWAGKRVFPISGQFLCRDHPRVGGEKSRVAPRSDPGTGSPPRGRGKVSSVSMCTRSPGITPAWAGKRSCCASRSRSLKDHPRVGGEKLTSLPKIQPALGSPPRGRGKAGTLYSGMQRVGITPAWAGKRLKRSHRSGIFISGPIPFHSVLHRPAGSGGSRAGRDGSPAGQPQNTGPA